MEHPSIGDDAVILAVALNWLYTNLMAQVTASSPRGVL
jgi:hypothetical protein